MLRVSQNGLFAATFWVFAFQGIVADDDSFLFFVPSRVISGAFAALQGQKIEGNAMLGDLARLIKEQLYLYMYIGLGSRPSAHFDLKQSVRLAMGLISLGAPRTPRKADISRW